MTHLGPAHWAMLVVCVVGLVPAVVAGRRPWGESAARVAGYALGLTGIASTALDLLTRYDVDVSLPLQLSDLAWMSASVALVTRHRLAVALTFFWGLTLTSQAIAAPSLAETFPDVRYFGFWVLHLGTLWAAAHLTFGARLAPSWADYRRCVAVTSAWLVSVLAFNLVAGTNYGYLVRKPRSASLLDLLGPWPVYLLAEIVILAALWALLARLAQGWAARGSDDPAPDPAPDAPPRPQGREDDEPAPNA